MTRLHLVAAAAVLSMALPVMAQTKPGPSPQAMPPAQAPLPAPGSDAWLLQRGETYSAASDAEQDPAEVAETEKLNSAIIANNDAAARAEAEAAAAHEAERARWQQEAARSSTARAQWEADAAAAAAARARYERERAAWEASVAACRASGRVCLTNTEKR